MTSTNRCESEVTLRSHSQIMQLILNL